MGKISQNNPPGWAANGAMGKNALALTFLIYNQTMLRSGRFAKVNRGAWLIYKDQIETFGRVRIVARY